MCVIEKLPEPDCYFNISTQTFNQHVGCYDHKTVYEKMHASLNIILSSDKGFHYLCPW